VDPGLSRRWPVLLAQRDGPLQPCGLSRVAANQPDDAWPPASCKLEGHGIPDFCPVRQRAELPGQQPVIPRSFGIVIRCASIRGHAGLYPHQRAWRNGMWSGQRYYGQDVLSQAVVPELRGPQAQSKNFQRFHNRHHRYRLPEAAKPDGVLADSDYRPVVVPPNARVPRIEEIPEGTIILIRFIRSDRNWISSGAVRRCQRAGLLVCQSRDRHRRSRLKVYLGEELVEAFEYRMPPETWE